MFRRYAAIVAAIRLANTRQEPVGLADTDDDDTDWTDTNTTLAAAVKQLGTSNHWTTHTNPTTGEINITPIPKDA